MVHSPIPEDGCLDSVHNPSVVLMHGGECDDVTAGFPDFPYEVQSTTPKAPAFVSLPLSEYTLVRIPESFLSFASKSSHPLYTFPDPPLEKIIYAGFLSPLRA